MYWTPTTDPTTSEVVGVSVALTHAGRAGLELEYGGDRRMRLMHAREPVLWARVEPRYEGVWVVRRRGERVLGVLPPIRAQEARANRSGLDWMKWVAAALARSTTPLRSGTWQLTELRLVEPSLRDRARGATPDVLLSRDPDGLPSPAYGLRDAWFMPHACNESWGINGSGGVIPLRDPAEPDAARVKSWRKHARAGTLPPVVLWWVTALDMYVLVDGHDRLQAAAAEGVQPGALALWQAHREPDEHVAAWRPELVRRYERAFASAMKPSLPSRFALNRNLVEAFRGYRRARTLARARYNLRAEWTQQVQAELADDPGLARQVCGT